MKANTKRMDKDGNSRPQGYRVYEITGDIPALGLGGGIAGASCLINDTRMKDLIVIQKTHGNTITFKNNMTGTLQRGGSNVMDKVPNILINEEIHDTLEPGHDTNNKGGVETL